MDLDKVVSPNTERPTGRMSLSPSVRSPSYRHSSTPSPSRARVRATLTPLQPPSRSVSRSRASNDSPTSSIDVSRRSFDITRDKSRSSFDMGRRSLSLNRPNVSTTRPGDRSPLSPRLHDEDSITQSLDPDTESSAAIQSLDDTNASASQLLSRSDIFRRPVITHRTASDPVSRRTSQDTARSSAQKQRPLPSPRTETEHTLDTDRTDPSKKSSRRRDEESDVHHGKMQTSGSSTALKDLVRAGARASGFSGFFRKRSKEMGNLLSTSPMGYVEKVSGMLIGGTKHYGQAQGLAPDDRVESMQDAADTEQQEASFRKHFALPESEKLRATYFANMQRVIPQYGKIYLSNRHFCFRSLVHLTKTQVSVKDMDRRKLLTTLPS